MKSIAMLPRLACGFCCLTALALTLALARDANARVIKLNITKTESPTFSGASFGAVGTYTMFLGNITGEVDPDDPQNAVIVDIEKAPRQPDGMVQYSSDFQIIMPTNPALGNGRVVFDLPNRGGAGALSSFNATTAINNMTTAGSPGNGFLMNQGYTLVEGAWDITAAQGGKSFGVTFPVAKNRDGSSITGPALEELVVDTNGTPATLPLTYAAASADQSKASLTVRANYGDTPILVPAAQWAYTDSTLTAVKLTSGPFGAPPSFGPTVLYEFSYIAKDPIVVGLGFAALRDLATFLRDAAKDDVGTANPLAGHVDRIYTTCISQPCRTMNDFLLWGFNAPDKRDIDRHRDGDDRDRDARDGDDHDRDADRDRDDHERHELVFDGVLNWIAGGDGIYMNYRFAQPTRTQRQHIARWYPEFQFPWANQDTFDPVTRHRDGRLNACDATDTCPKIFETNSENEFYSKGGSLLLTDTAGQDLDLDSRIDREHVRYYLLSSFPHGAGTAAGICRQPQNPLIPGPVLRALLGDLDAWVSSGHEPPANRIPRRGDGTLEPSLPQAGMGFPNIPGVTYNGIMHTGDLFNFGPRFDDGIISVMPPQLLGTPYPVFVPKTDIDGNDIAGVRTPDIVVPVATYTGYALRASPATETGGAKIVDGCDASGQRIPFAKLKTDRSASGDPRLSLQERYADHATYVSLVTAAAKKLEADGFLLDADAQAYITAANAASVP
jgi:hypothetical protein